MQFKPASGLLPSAMKSSSSRPEDFLELVQRSKRGRLKVYMGFAAGVGKTYRMLEEAHALQKRGVDIVIGFIETHGRVETEALVAGLDVIPRKRIEYRGLAIEEMDLDAILARKPEVVIVDELPHTNVPGSRHTKRYQDVLEILQAGINVICASTFSTWKASTTLSNGPVAWPCGKRFPTPFSSRPTRW